jgi:hypothetical protein
MSKTSDSGHATNVANFEKIATYVTDLGAAYNPSKDSIKVPALLALVEQSKETHKAANAAEGLLRTVIKARKQAFIPLSSYVTRVLNMLKSSDSSELIDESINGLARKLQGRRATPKKTDEELAEAHDEGKEVRNSSSSQMGFNNRVDNFDKFIETISNIPEYHPNEEDVKIEAMKALYADLSGKNHDVINAESALKNARIARNDVFYAKNTGLVDISVDVKNYVKGVFGATSPQYKAISAIKLVRRK